MRLRKGDKKFGPAKYFGGLTSYKAISLFLFFQIEAPSFLFRYPEKSSAWNFFSKFQGSCCVNFAKFYCVFD